MMLMSIGRWAFLKKYSYFVIGLILHIGWFFLAFYTYLYTGAEAISRMFESFNDDYTTTLNFFSIASIMQILLLLLSLFIFGYHLWFLNKSKLRKRIKALQFFLIFTIGFLAGGLYLYWWYNTPPMSEKAAIKYAEEQVKGDNNLKFHSIDLNGNKTWIVKFESINDQNSCTNVKINRGYSYATHTDCE